MRLLIPTPAAVNARIVRPGAVHLDGTKLLMAAMGIGSAMGIASPHLGQSFAYSTDPLILALVSLLFFEIRYGALRRLRENLRFLGVAWCANFVVIPLFGFAIAWLFLRDQPLLFAGLLIYFMAPCTDWFLVFTRMARGNTALGAALIPVNMVSQILLYPVYLGLLAGAVTRVDSGTLFSSLLNWFVIPLAGAALAHLALRKILAPALFEAALAGVEKLIPVLLAALVAGLFTANIDTIVAHAGAFLLILVAVFLFFLATYLLAELISKTFRFSYPEHALLTMTTAARNAPLMLAVTMAALPNQPLIYAAILIGMLVEFPHLTALVHLLVRNRRQQTGSGKITPTRVTRLRQS